METTHPEILRAELDRKKQPYGERNRISGSDGNGVT
jgi:hypothetical protein